MSDYSFSDVIFNGICLFVIVFFFFSSRRRHTRYIGDWSSDVCSSDLVPKLKRRVTSAPLASKSLRGDQTSSVVRRNRVRRSEERRVGKECRARGGAEHEKKKKRECERRDREEEEQENGHMNGNDVVED